MFKKKEKIKDAAIYEIEKLAKAILEKVNWSFDVMQERDLLEKKCETAKSKNKEYEVTIKGYEKILEERNKTIDILNEKYKELFDLFEKITGHISITNEELAKEVEELKSNRYKVVEIKSRGGRKPKTQEMKIASSTVKSKIIKNVKKEGM